MSPGDIVTLCSGGPTVPTILTLSPFLARIFWASCLFCPSSFVSGFYGHLSLLLHPPCPANTNVIISTSFTLTRCPFLTQSLLKQSAILSPSPPPPLSLLPLPSSSPSSVPWFYDLLRLNPSQPSCRANWSEELTKSFIDLTSPLL